MTIEASRKSLIQKARDYLDSRPVVTPSVLLPELDLKSILKLEAGDHHPVILAVGPTKGLLRSTVAAMVGEYESFSNMFPVNDYGAARIAFMAMHERSEPIGIVAIDMRTMRYGENWTDLVKDIRREEPKTKIILFGDVSRRQKREFGINRVVRNP